MRRCFEVVFGETSDDSDVMRRNILLAGLEEIPALPDGIDADGGCLAGKGPARGDGPPQKKAPREAMVLHAKK